MQFTRVSAPLDSGADQASPVQPGKWGWMMEQVTTGIPSAHGKHSRWRAFILGAVVLLAAPQGWAGELNLLINGHARHINPPANSNFNERNWGFGLQYDYERTPDGWVPFLTGSGFKDSERNMSYYAGGGLQYRFDVAPKLDNLHVDLGGVAFLMKRKTFKNNDPFFGALPAATVGTDHFSLNFTYVPKVHPKLIPLWFVQLKIPFGKY